MMENRRPKPLENTPGDSTPREPIEVEVRRVPRPDEAMPERSPTIDISSVAGVERPSRHKPPSAQDRFVEQFGIKTDIGTPDGGTSYGGKVLFNLKETTPEKFLFEASRIIGAPVVSEPVMRMLRKDPAFRTAGLKLGVDGNPDGSSDLIGFTRKSEVSVLDTVVAAVAYRVATRTPTDSGGDLFGGMVAQTAGGQLLTFNAKAGISHYDMAPLFKPFHWIAPQFTTNFLLPIHGGLGFSGLGFGGAFNRRQVTAVQAIDEDGVPLPLKKSELARKGEGPLKP